jgi:branched-chain amino acid transport system substrate-binding protein
MKAWVKWTNDTGGINGHPVEAFYADDKSDPALALAAVKDLVETKGVIAIVGETAASTQQTWAPYVLSKRIPVVNGPTIDALWFTNPMFYPIATTVISGIWGQMDAAKQAGANKVAVVLCTEVAACAQAQPLFAADAKAVGLDLVYNALASQTQASYTAECIAMKNAGAEAVAAFVNQVVMSRDCGRQDFHPFWISSALAPTPQTVKTAPELGNSVGSVHHWPCITEKAPGPIQEYLSVMRKYGAAKWVIGGSQFDQVAEIGCTVWGGAVAFRKAIENAAVPATATATNEDVIKGLSMFKNETLGGVAPDVTLSDGTKPNPQQKCTWLYQRKGTALLLLPGDTGALTCQP